LVPRAWASLPELRRRSRVHGGKLLARARDGNRQGSVPKSDSKRRGKDLGQRLDMFWMDTHGVSN